MAKTDRQIVALVTKPMDSYIREEAGRISRDESDPRQGANTEVIREMLDEAKALRDIAAERGRPVGLLLDVLRKLPPVG